MDEKKKQAIEEMELVMHNSFGCRYFNTKEMILNNDRIFNREATEIYNAGYRKESDTAREILQMYSLSDTFSSFQKKVAEKYGVDLGEAIE